MSNLLYEAPPFLRGIEIDQVDDDSFVALQQSVVEPANPTDFILDLIRECKDLETQATAIEARMKELRDKHAAKKRGVERLRGWAKSEMLARGLNKCKDADYTVSLAKPKATLVVTDESKVPKVYFKEQAPKLDKQALQDTFNAYGDIPDGCDVKETRTLTVRG